MGRRAAAAPDNRRMPDELAGRATLLLLGGIVAAAALGPGVAWLWRLTHPRSSGVRPGLVAGLAVFVLAMGLVTADLSALAHTQQRWLQLPGLLLGHEAVKLRESRGGRKLIGRGPVVEFDLPDGSRHAFRGLAGSLAQRAAGDTVPVRVDPADPARAIVDDFQHRFAALWLFASFGGVALLGLLQTLTSAWADGRPAPTAAWSRWRDGAAGQGWRAVFVRAAWAGGALSVFGVFVAAEFGSVGGAFAVGLGGLAAALVSAAVAGALAVGVHWQTRVFGTLAVVGGTASAAVWLRQLIGV